MKYRVIRRFKDLQDGMHAYSVGDTYPRAYYVASQERIEELLSSHNKMKQPLIEKVEEEVKEVVEDKPKKKSRAKKK